MRAARERRGIAIQSPVNLVVSDGSSLVATRFAFDYGWYPDDDSFFASEREHDFTTLWFSAGARLETRGGGLREVAGAKTTSVIIASEPLTTDRSLWLEAPEYSLTIMESAGDELSVESRELAL